MGIYHNEEQELIEKLQKHPNLKAYFLEMVNFLQLTLFLLMIE